ncbi:MAG: hypothetical protein QXX87_05545 [Candidatus Jordarchaeales archaeon]
MLFIVILTAPKEAAKGKKSLSSTNNASKLEVKLDYRDVFVEKEGAR